MTELFPKPGAGAAELRRLLDEPGLTLAPGCFDGLSARMLEAAGHRALFCGGFSVAAATLGLPDVGLLSYGEMVDQIQAVTAATAAPVIADADTGYGNAVNAQRSVLGFARAGAACVMIEDQRWPKQCGHTIGKQVVDRDEAIGRVRAAVEIRDRHGVDVMIMARTDAAAAIDFDEAVRRASSFAEVGADLTFLEAPETVDEMARYCREVPGHKVANMVEDGRTPWLSPAELEDLGYSLALYPVSVLLHAANAMKRVAETLLRGESVRADRVAFDEIRAAVGWPDYAETAARHDNDQEDRQWE